MAFPSPTVIVRLSGGLGNQMFQYAFGRAVARERNLLFDASSFSADRLRDFRLDCFGLDLKWSSVPFPAAGILQVPGIWRLMRRLGGAIPLPGCCVVWDRMTGFDPGVESKEGSMVATGYWQDARYFTRIEDEIRETFKPVGHFGSETLSLMKSSGSAIGVQVRRGDYANERVQTMHPTQSVTYYREAVAGIARAKDVNTAIVCSDDPEWARRNLDLPVERTIYREETAEDWEDMFLLAECAHLVISNSSFGWWSAWLGKAEGRTVICPKKWYGSRGAAFSHPGLDTWEFVQY